jgi:hypothetical protein|tara:strand:+ start:336 stop:554 length:219 start_codon:yes stop_codon:yes gene_type:complete
MLKQYGILLLYIVVIAFLLLSACAKKDVTIPELRPPIRLPDIDEEEGEDLPEEDTAVDEEILEEDWLDERDN